MQLASNMPEQRARSDSTPYSPTPGSPTLTNPDLILPDYDDGTDTLDQLRSSLEAWKNSHASELGLNLSPEAFTAGPITPTTPIIYGNGTMLSDIGEVTEVESTCGPTRSRSGSTRSEITMVTSTALPYEAIKQRIKQARMAHQRQMSVDSNSTVTAHETPGLFVDFDDTVSVDDSNFQGDDEDSVAESYVDDASALENAPRARELALDPDEARYSTPLSRRAEQILANAKRRLTTMEGNLNRARSSLYSPTMSSVDSQSTPSPPVGRPATSNGLGNRRLSHGHNRISSESSIPTDIIPSMPAQRSVSAFGTAGGYRRPLQGSRNPDMHDRTSGVSSSLHGQDQPLEPLSEDGIFEETGINGHSIENAKGDVYLNPVGSVSDKGLKRSVSSLQMRDLKDQVNDLKGRLSTLRDQARADSLKRRSLQSLRTPSPFTHARVDQWYADANSHEDGATQHSSSNVQATTESSTSLQDRTGSPVKVEAALEGQDNPPASQPNYADAPTGAAMFDSSESQPTPYVETIGVEANVDPMNELDDTDDVRTEDGYEFAEDNDFDDSASESGASSYHDTVQAQVSHEDREDAFDYEHFFLHSAMGSMTRKRMRRKGSNDSFSSEGSVETTRGPATSQPSDITAIPTGHRSRRGSAGSTSTMDSFATATEGRHTRVGTMAGEYDDEYDEYNDVYPEQVVTLPVRARTHTPDTAKRMVFSPEASDSGSDPRQSQSSLHHRPQSSAAAFKHRPTASTLSTGTNRSFPLIHKMKGDKVGNTPNGSTEQGLQQISETLMNETASIFEKENRHDGEKAAPMQMLQKDDQILVERLVASLGRCVLGLTEAGRASAEARAYRRKIETAYRILEGFE